jgi:hypothetical protein
MNQPSEAEVHRAERVDKPWGHEEIFALVEGSYVGKLLFVSAGESLSLQYHHAKDETIALVSGRVEIDLGTSADTLRALSMSRGTPRTWSPACCIACVPSRTPSWSRLRRRTRAGARTSSGSRTATAGSAPPHLNATAP